MIWKYWEKDVWYKRFAWFPKRLSFYANTNPRDPNWYYLCGHCWIWLSSYYTCIARQGKDNWMTVTIDRITPP